MNKLLLQRIFTILTFLSIITLFFIPSQPVQSQAGTAAQLLAEINGVRAANGLVPLVENIYLNLAAQVQADYIAETGIGSHIGEDGSTVSDRALAVGYGEGATIWATENWAKGPGLTASACVYDMWVTSPDHLDNILTTWHNEFGAGVALDINGFTVYVAVFGHTSNSTVPVQDQPTTISSEPTATQEPYIQPVTTSTPNPDGSVIHIVQPGQSLWAIADAYDVSLADILALNGLTEEDAIFPDQQLLILPASVTLTPTSETPVAEDFTPTPQPSPTPTETPQITPTADEPTPTPTPEKKPSFIANIFSGDTLWVGIGLVAVSVLGIVLLLYTSSRLK
jgi:uncharacterized protein YkwD